ncbi:MAG: hypothetical protein EOM23_09115, partial [Candidatus Moranbacteria bacterium]|nr:hypothetical protein [Candidatus Moranbacteria bacterium]
MLTLSMDLFSGETFLCGDGLINSLGTEIGRAYWTDILYTLGQISDVRVYNRTLSEAEISELAKVSNINKKVVQGGLVGWWTIDDYTDKSGNGNDGTAYGGVTQGLQPIATDSTPNGNDGIVYGATLAEGRKGESGGSYGFDGSIPNSIYLGRPEIQNFTPQVDEFSICSWYKSTSRGIIYSFGGSTSI